MIKPNKAPAYPRYASDFMSDIHVRSMTTLQEGVYSYFLDLCWLERCLPEDENELLKLCKKDVTLEDVLVVKKRFQKACFLDCKGGYQLVTGCLQDGCSHLVRLVHQKHEKIRMERESWIEKSRIGGQNSAKKRWGSKKSKAISITSEDDKGGYKMLKPLVTECLSNGGNQIVTFQSSSSNLNTNTKYIAEQPDSKPPPKPPLSPKKGDPRVKNILDHFHEKHLEKFEQPPIIDAKAGSLVKKLLETYKSETFLIEIVDRFFKTENDFVRQAGSSFGVFYSQVQKLVTGGKEKTSVSGNISAVISKISKQEGGAD